MNYAALNTYIEASRDEPFKWGKHDCCQFAAGAYEALTGRNFMDAEYATKGEAIAIIKARGGLKRILLDKGLAPHHPAFARRGDVAYHIDKHPMLGIVLGREMALVGQEGNREGLVMIPTLDCIEVFRE